MLILLLALAGSIACEAPLSKNNQKQGGVTKKRTITQDVVDILKEIPYTVGCSGIYFKGMNVEGDSSLQWRTEKVEYVKDGDVTNFKYVFRIPADTKLWQIKKGIVTKCREFKDLGPDTTIVLIADWNEWSTCDVMQCKQRRSRPCLECQRGSEVELRACNDTQVCIKPCYTLQEPALTEDSDLVLSWALGDQCVGEPGRVRISSAGRLVHLLPVAANTTAVQFPYNSQKSYNIGIELKGRYNGTASDLLDTINFNETTFNFHCKKRTSEEAYDLTCQYDALVKINITINDVLQGDYTGKGSIALAESFCNESKTVQISAKSNSGEEIDISEYLESRNDAPCNGDTFMSPNEVSDDNDDDVIDTGSDVIEADNTVTEPVADDDEEAEAGTKFPSISNIIDEYEENPVVTESDVITVPESDVIEEGPGDVIETATMFPTLVVDDDEIEEGPTNFPTIPPSIEDEVEDAEDTEEDSEEEDEVEDAEATEENSEEENEVEDYEENEVTGSGSETQIFETEEEDNGLGEGKGGENERDKYLNEKYGQDSSHEYDRDEDKYKYDKYGEKIIEDEEEEPVKGEESQGVNSGTVAMEVLNTLLLVLIPFWVL